eukprot:m.128050 g.128050  ORF g.128050 m.128050 type:complete len:64 (-) comp13017_c1_seq3:2354-2545(-)
MYTIDGKVQLMLLLTKTIHVGTLHFNNYSAIIKSHTERRFFCVDNDSEEFEDVRAVDCLQFGV